MAEPILHNFYNSNFFEDLRDGSHQSAVVIVPLILDWVNPSSVVDVGCGDGTWLSVFQGHGVDDILGLDGSYVQAETLQIPQEYFLPKDLSQPIFCDRTFDLAISLEVAEHLLEESAPGFVASLVKLSEVVLFSAAIPHQGGTNHVNEQWPAYWISLFEAQGYVAIDILRERLWNNTNVQPWYAQNSFFFVRSDRLSDYPELQKNLTPTHNPRRAIVHPDIYLQHCPTAAPEAQNGSNALDLNPIIQILGVTFHPSAEIQSGESLSISIEYQATSPLETAIFILSLSDEAGQIYIDTETIIISLQTEGAVPSVLQLTIQRLDLAQGTYFINPGIVSSDWTQTYDFHWHQYPVVIKSPIPLKGVLQPPMQWSICSKIVQ